MKVGTKCKIITKYGIKFLTLYEQLLKELEVESYNREYLKYVDVEDFINYIDYNEDENEIREVLVSLLLDEGFEVDNNRDKFCDGMFSVILRED